MSAAMGVSLALVIVAGSRLRPQHDVVHQTVTMQRTAM